MIYNEFSGIPSGWNVPLGLVSLLHYSIRRTVQHFGLNSFGLTKKIIWEIALKNRRLGYSSPQVYW
jgi:hypothetical protein